MKHYKNKNNEIYSYDDDISKEILDVKIKELGLVVVSDADLALLRLPKIEDVKISKTNEINIACDNAIVSGFYSSVLGEKHFYYSTIAEQSTLNSLINLGADLEFKAQKVNVDGDGVETLGARVKYLHTNTQLIGVLADGATHIGTQVEKKDQLEALIEQATTIDEVNAIQW